MADAPATQLSDPDFDPARLSRVYDDFAADCDASRGAFDNRAQLARLEALLTRPARVLACVCGSGLPVLRHFAARGDPVVGSDLSPAMLAVGGETMLWLLIRRPA